MSRFAAFLLVLLFSARLQGQGDDFAAAFSQGVEFLKQEQAALAATQLESALQRAGAPPETAEAAGWLGLARMRLRQWDRAQAAFERAIAIDTGNPNDRARWRAGLAELQARSGHGEEADRLFAQALGLAGGDFELRAGIELSQARWLPFPRKLAALTRIAEHLAMIEPPEARGRYLVSLGTQAATLEAQGIALARTNFNQVRQIPRAAPRVRAEALAGLARLEGIAGNFDASEHLYAEAILAAGAVSASDLLADMEWQRGRALKAAHRTAEALAAYRRAAEQMRNIRLDLSAQDDTGPSARDTVGALNWEYADLLFQAADRAADAGETVRLLKEARDAVESIKIAEMADFLGDRCGLEMPAKKPVEQIERGTAVLYPILFPDRLELLVSSGDDFQRFTQLVEAAEIRRDVEQLDAALRNRRVDFMASARALHRRLIEPVDPWLKARAVKTVVIVPDGTLRRIPLAALHDGERFLVQRYAIATSPGLKLFEAVRRSPEPSALLAGVSRPGPVVEHLPDIFYEALVAGGQDRWGRSAEDDASTRVMIEALRNDPGFRQDVREKMVLKGVEDEVDGLKQSTGGQVLMNDRFTTGRLARELREGNYSIIHIAAHGFFGPTPRTSFIVAYDGILDIAAFEQMFTSMVAKGRPVDLLVLSACQTAEGDDRSPLGLSGVALKGNVRSALGSLWPVSDSATSHLMLAFYDALRRPENSKVEALRQAQLQVLAHPDFREPFYWAPFILVGNWL